MAPETRVGTWDTLKLHPMALMRMVIQGEATVIGRDERGRKVYEVKHKRRLHKGRTKRD